MNWRFVRFAVAGYTAAWIVVLYCGAMASVVAGPFDVRDLIGWGLFLAPFGAMFGAIGAAGPQYPTAETDD